MPRPLDQQIVVITGASSGIGRATALAFARARASVVAAARGHKALETLVDEIEAGGGQAIAVPTDVADPAAVHALADRAVAEYGGITTWVNNAAVMVYGSVDDTTDEEFEAVTRVNYLGQVYGTRAALPHLRASGDGVLIGVGSVESYRPVPLQAAYGGSKFAIRGFYDVLRVELAIDRAPVAVCLVLPAAINTPLFDHARSKIGARPRVPPPVYQPEIVAEAIVRAAQRPTREVPVGGSAVAFLLAERLAPAVTDAVLSLGGVIVKMQKRSEPAEGPDNLEGPLEEVGAVRGDQPGPILSGSAFTRTIAHLPRPGELLSGLLAARRRA